MKTRSGIDMGKYFTYRFIYLISIVQFGLFFLFACDTQYSGIPKSYHPLLDTAINKAGDNAPSLQNALNNNSE